MSVAKLEIKNTYAANKNTEINGRDLFNHIWDQLKDKEWDFVNTNTEGLIFVDMYETVRKLMESDSTIPDIMEESKELIKTVHLLIMYHSRMAQKYNLHHGRNLLLNKCMCRRINEVSCNCGNAKFPKLDYVSKITKCEWFVAYAIKLEEKNGRIETNLELLRSSEGKTSLMIGIIILIITNCITGMGLILSIIETLNLKKTEKENHMQIMDWAHDYNLLGFDVEQVKNDVLNAGDAIPGAIKDVINDMVSRFNEAITTVNVLKGIGISIIVFIGIYIVSKAIKLFFGRRIIRLKNRAIQIAHERRANRKNIRENYKNKQVEWENSDLEKGNVD